MFIVKNGSSSEFFARQYWQRFIEIIRNNFCFPFSLFQLSLLFIDNKQDSSFFGRVSILSKKQKSSSKSIVCQKKGEKEKCNKTNDKCSN